MKKDSSLIELLGNSPTLRVLDFFIDNNIFDYSMTNVVREIHMSPSTIQPIWNNLKERKLIIKTRKIGRADLCKLNMDSNIIKQLMNLDIKLAMEARK